MNEQEYLQTFDELHNLTIEKRDELTESEFLDWAESVLILAYSSGVRSTLEDLNETDLVDMTIDLTDIDNLKAALDFVVDGKTYKDRLTEYYNEGSDAEIQRVMETEYHRMFNTGGYDTAVREGATTKTWHCMGLPTSRETHIYLDGMTRAMDEAFFTYNGNSAMYPHAFNEPSEDINCLCWLTYSR